MALKVLSHKLNLKFRILKCWGFFNLLSKRNDLGGPMPAVLSSQKNLLENSVYCIRFIWALSLWFEVDLLVKWGTAPRWHLNSIVRYERSCSVWYLFFKCSMLEFSRFWGWVKAVVWCNEKLQELVHDIFKLFVKKILAWSFPHSNL